MELKFPAEPLWIVLMVGIFFSTVGYTAYYFLSFSNFIRNKFSNIESDNNVRKVLFKRLLGVTIFGIIPTIIIFFTGGAELLTEMAGKPGISTLYFLIPCALIVLLLNYVNAGKPQNLAMYPEIRKREWTISLLLLSSLSWIAYLFAYEILFRVLLFVPALKLMGFWPAVILNMGIYSLVHVPKSKVEGIGAIFLGFIFCLLVVLTGSFWIAFLVHVFLALGNEWFSIMKNSEIRIVRI